MSRHRDIKNLSKDDYYDYDDDYYYDDEDFGEYDDGELYHNMKPKTTTTTKPVVIKNPSTSNTTTTKKVVDFSISKSNPAVSISASEKEKLEKERLITSMGFSIEDAKLALTKYNWDVESAINDLLSGPSLGTKATTMAPPSEPALLPSHTSKVLKTLAPLTAAATCVSKSLKPNKKSNEYSSHSITTSHHSTYPKKLIPQDLQEKLKSQKSRLTMVILGHVDHGKSTLMGQVLVQTGVVDKRTVSKYEKQGKIYTTYFRLQMDEVLIL